MATNPPIHPLRRAASSLALAITAATLSVGGTIAPAHGAAPQSLPAAQNSSAVRPPEAIETSTSSTISVLIADGHMVFRSGLRAVIGAQPDIECVAEVGDGAAAIHEIQRLQPDVALICLDMPGLDHPAAGARTAEFGGATQILTLTNSASDENLYRARCLGASGFLAKSLPAAGLVSAIRTAAHGTALIDPSLTRRLIARLTTGIEPFPAAPEVETLTAREHEVLLLIANAYTNPEIAQILGVGEQTVKTHVSNVLAKLGVRDRVHAAVYAHTRRIVPREPHVSGVVVPGRS
ncbi:response regulator transcription factor [Nocardia sp. NBC_01503]|uniref:response regulator transcription factor n=1 Tax=Nocardia sp. NBC_01503 TaxID=2975997 RepID=UPI002E7C0E8F|nr:response regulator transcription factor [Nocardia sp. NBC_01503]WTL30829.1 response regulator transcription factor [Nocardia sp. NBC_01503]